ncbi:hypothetical protein BJ508DRAFT_76949 [Ascobolus immersus RN42]|uniref:Nephrocystin 3-like N-terminal domain-containing protein n=1 Tax=Ascobolus immersus RN42 TaxID=1160509 RepID=A0A3N4HHH7_ASCIM|nr:hypothetical protein BJ508DRAFT_76949 [Ascobolus immersus RN42]
MAEIVGLVASITQFSVYGFKILKAAREAQNSVTGLSEQHSEMVVVCENALTFSAKMTEALEDLKRNGYSEGGDEAAVRRLGGEAEKLASELLAKLKVVKSQKGRQGMMDSLKDGIRALWMESEIKDLQSRLGNIMTALFSCSSSFIRDKQYESNFVNLDSNMSEIRQMLTKVTENIDSKQLNSAVPDTDHSTLGNSIVQLGTIIDDYIFEREVVRMLDYETANRRWEKVEQSHMGTCNWIFDASTGFLSWLKEESGIYWIHGKPGSGKSTLMKHVLRSPTTEAALQIWAGDARLLFIRHFFWISGHDNLQTSLEGLYRNILIQIFRAEPRVIIESCREVRDKSSWDRDDLRLVLQTLCTLLDCTPTKTDLKIAVFIDGLDEYDKSQGGHELDVVQVVKMLAKCNRLKVCVSSRPWAVFRNEFESDLLQVAVHEYTLQDMAKFALDHLVELNAYQRSLKHDERWRSLATDVAERAEGVWLWTSLVAKNILREVADGERYERVREVLDEIPQDLDNYFRELGLVLGTSKTPFGGQNSVKRKVGRCYFSF